MKKLSKEQTKAIESKSQHLLIIAGAGTGKTTVLTTKIKRLLKANVEPSEILAITFTKKAAIEMKSRIKNESVLIYTFDALCYNLIVNDYNIDIIKDNIPFYRKDVLSFHLYDANMKMDKKPDGYDSYVQYKKDNFVYDFNDIEYLALKHLKVKNLNIKYILVDEFQDTNKLQLEILKTLIKKSTSSFVVGDPDQSIYAFRGAYKKIFNDYIEIYDPEILKLTINFRSDKKIIDIANNLIKSNIDRFDKILICNSKNLGEVSYNNFINEDKEVEFIINTYNNMEKSGNMNVAVLYRNHGQAYNLKRKLFNYNTKIRVLSIHEAKGLEFDVVFIIGVNKDVFPSSRSNNIKKLEEERRLMFVAVTRSKSILYISSINNPSMFIREITLK